MTDTNHSKQADAIPALDVPAGSAWAERTTGKTVVVTKVSYGCITWHYYGKRASWLTTSGQFQSRFYRPNARYEQRRGKDSA